MTFFKEDFMQVFIEHVHFWTEHGLLWIVIWATFYVFCVDSTEIRRKSVFWIKKKTNCAHSKPLDTPKNSAIGMDLLCEY